MNDSRFVRRLEAVGGLGDQLQLDRNEHFFDAALLLAPRPQIAPRDVIRLDVERSLIQENIVETNQVWMFADALLEEAEEGQLALEKSDALDLKAELENAALLGGRIPAQPDFATTAFAQLGFQLPAGVGDKLADGRTPAQNRFALRGDLALRFLRSGRRLQGSDSRLSHFAHLQRGLNPFQQIRPMIEPFQQPHSSNVLAFEHLPGVVEGGACQQDLSALGQVHNARAGIDLDAVKIAGFESAGMFLYDHFAEVNSDSILQLHSASLGKAAHPRL